MAHTSLIEVEPIQPRIFCLGSNRPAEFIQALERATIAFQNPFFAGDACSVFDSEVGSEYLEAPGKQHATSRIKKASSGK
jgi:hypothetical protein